MGHSAAEELDAHVNFPRIHQTAGANLEFQEAFTICSQRDLIVHSGGEKAKMRRRKIFSCDFFQVEDVDGFCRRRNFGARAEVAAVPA